MLLAALASAGFAQNCAATNDAATYPNPPLTYPMTSDRYAVQYQLGGSGAFTNAQVYISYYGGTNSSPYINASRYPADESMSFVSIPVSVSTAVSIRVTKIFGSNFPAISRMSVRPTAKGIQVSSVSPTVVQVSTTTAADFAGDQFILYWNGTATESGAVQGLAIFLNPPYTKPTGSNVKVIATPADLSSDLSPFDTLDIEGTVAVASTGAFAFVVPANINNIFLGPAGWFQGKLRFTQSGVGHTRKIYGPGVLDGSRFNYAYRHCDATSDYPDDGFQSISWIRLPGKINGVATVPDGFIVDGVIITDNDYYATDWFNNTTINNLKIIGWNGNNDGIQMGITVRVSNVFIHTGDDSLKMWGSYITVTNATVWQTWNGGVINLGWFDNSPGDGCLIDGVYVVKTDWSLSNIPTWTSTGLNFDNSAIVASLMVPGTNYGASLPSVFRNIYVEDPPRVLFSLKITPPLALGQPTVDLSLPSVLKLNIENVATPASKLQNSIGFQTVSGPPLTGSINIGLSNVMITPPGGTATALTSANAATLGDIVTNGDHVSVEYGGPAVSLVANAEGESPTIAPNTWVEIKGSNLAPMGFSSPACAPGYCWQASDFANNKMPTQLDGVSATVNGKSAFVYYISPAQLNILTPPDSMSGTVQVQVTNNGVPATAVTAQAQPLSPSFFVFNGGPYVAGTHLNGSYLGPTTLYPGLTTPAKPNEIVVIYANGFGTASTPVVSGSVVQSGTLSPLPVVKIGGITATVQFAGLVAPGEYQFNVVVPPTLGDGDQPIVATYNGLSTQPGALISIQH
jgi:uncharacterized protein (TIGR03437 family)